MKQYTIKVEILPDGRERYAMHCSNCGDTQRVERVLVGREVLLPAATQRPAAVTEDEELAEIALPEASDPPEASEPPKPHRRKAAAAKPRRPPTPRPRARAGAKGGR